MFSYSSVAQSDERSRKLLTGPVFWKSESSFKSLNPSRTIDKTVRFCKLCQRKNTPTLIQTLGICSWIFHSNGWYVVIELEVVKNSRHLFFFIVLVFSITKLRQRQVGICQIWNICHLSDRIWSEIAIQIGK